jgi:sulfur carrier protein ThiS
MKLRIKLMGMLKDHSPENGELELPEQSTIGDVLKALAVDSESIQAFSVNGSIARDRSRKLFDGDELTVLPPVGGG